MCEYLSAKNACFLSGTSDNFPVVHPLVDRLLVHCFSEEELKRLRANPKFQALENECRDTPESFELLAMVGDRILRGCFEENVPYPPIKREGVLTANIGVTELPLRN